MPEPQTIDDRTIINNALARIGATPIGALDEDTPKCRQVLAIYYDRIDALLAMFGYSFSTLLYSLDAVPADAAHDYDTTINCYINGWLYAFALPGTRLSEPTRVLANPRLPNDPLTEYFIQGGVLYANRTPVWAMVPVRADPQSWPPAFRLAATACVAADLCVPIAHDAKLAADLCEYAEGPAQMQGRGGLVGAALVADASRARSVTAKHRSPLTDARLE